MCVCVKVLNLYDQGARDNCRYLAAILIYVKKKKRQKEGIRVLECDGIAALVLQIRPMTPASAALALLSFRFSFTLDRCLIDFCR